MEVGSCLHANAWLSMPALCAEPRCSMRRPAPAHNPQEPSPEGTALQHRSILPQAHPRTGAPPSLLGLAKDSVAALAAGNRAVMVGWAGMVEPSWKAAEAALRTPRSPFSL